MNLDETLDARRTQYGKFKENTIVMQGIKDLMRSAPGWAAMSADKRESLDMIASKIGRIVFGNAENIDSWHDIAGYAKLIEDVLASQ